MMLIFSIQLHLRNYTEAKVERLYTSELAFGVFFTAPWCEECKHVEEEVITVAANTRDVFTVLKADCSDLNQRDFCIENKIKKLPALVLFNHLPDKKPVHFTDEYIVGEMEAFIREYMNSPLHVSPHPQGLLSAFRNPPEERERPFVVFFTNGPIAPWSAYNLAIKYFTKATFMHQPGFSRKLKQDLNDIPFLENVTAGHFSCIVKIDDAFYYYPSHDDAFNPLDKWLRGLIGSFKDFV